VKIILSWGIASSGLISEGGQKHEDILVLLCTQKKKRIIDFSPVECKPRYSLQYGAFQIQQKSLEGSQSLKP